MEEKQEKAVVEYVSRDGQKIKLTPSIIIKYLVSGKAELVTQQELFLYMGVCKSRGLNPFIKDCYLIKYTPNDSAAIVVSIDYYRKRARAQRDCRGWKSGIVVKTANGLEYREGCIILENEELVGGWFEGQPDGWNVPMRKTINLSRYIKKTKEGNVTRFWSKENQPEQIAKVAESQGLRATWPDEFQGLYVDAERESMEAQTELAEAVGTEQEKKEVAEKLKDKLGDPEKKSVGEFFNDKEAEAPPPEEPAAEEQTESQEKVLADFGVWNRENWINLRQAGYSTFVFKNLESFKQISTALQAEAINKWNSLYPDDPFPQTPNEDPEPELSETTIDPEEVERQMAIRAITDDYDKETIQMALFELKFANDHRVLPLDALNVLSAKCKEIAGK